MNKFDLIINALQAAYEDQAGWIDKVNEALYAVRELQSDLEKPKQKPVAWLHPDKKVEVIAPTILGWFDKPMPLYVAPPRKEWVGLTDSDMQTIRDDAFVKNVDDIVWALQMARRIEAKLKKLNTVPTAQTSTTQEK